MLGASYRTEKAVALMTEMGLSEKIKLGLSYDFYFNELQPHNYGSAEIRLTFHFVKTEKEPLTSLAYFGTLSFGLPSIRRQFPSLFLIRILFFQCYSSHFLSITKCSFKPFVISIFFLQCL